MTTTNQLALIGLDPDTICCPKCGAGLCSADAIGWSRTHPGRKGLTWGLNRAENGGVTTGSAYCPASGHASQITVAGMKLADCTLGRIGIESRWNPNSHTYDLRITREPREPQ